MKHPRASIAMASLLALLVSCGGEAPPAETPSKATANAPAGDGICEEHGIQEAICTKCNPALIPVFRAKGNYCEEHGFPESACPICHPEKKGQLIVEATKKEEESEAPADGTKIRFKTKDTARMAGLKIAQAGEHPQNALLSTTATIVYDATRYAQINARSPGVVRELKVDLGAKVEPSTVLAVIASSEVGAERSKRKGAAAALEAAKANYSRIKELVDQGLAPRKDLLAAEAEVKAAQAEYEGSSASLGEIDKSARGSGGYGLTSPIAGIVIRRGVTLGHRVDVEEVLYEVADTSSMWAELDIPETDLASVAIGQAVAVRIDGLPGREFSGTISYIAPEVDRQTRTVKARAALSNPEGLLRANMFATALILGEQRTAVMVPREAVQRAKGVNLVFVRLAEDLYETRHVELLPDSGEGELVGIAKGLKAGEEVVTAGSFLLKTETLKESIGAGCCAGE